VLHAKFFTVDDVAGVIGSSNMDYRSFGLDYEISLMGTDPSFVADLQRISDAGYVVMRVAMLFLWLRAAHQDPPRRRACQTYAVTIGVAQIGWVLAVDAGGLDSRGILRVGRAAPADRDGRFDHRA
jgi:phosphatidylserine/phosphatidylglycerophosphate/cardiolipin synthase-like enzyme